MSGIFEKPIEGEKFVLFTLHYQPEISTMLYGKFYDNQLNLIQLLAKNTPVDYKVYVKEHPTRYGNKTLYFYKEIKKLPNVRLITPFYNTFDLIRQSSLIAVITGTAGFEGLLLGKSVITFGKVYFNLCDEVMKVDKIEELPKIIRERVDKKINKEELVNFMAAVLSGTFEGLVSCPQDCANRSVEFANISKLIRGFEFYLKHMKR